MISTKRFDNALVLGVPTPRLAGGASYPNFQTSLEPLDTTSGPFLLHLRDTE